MPSYLLSLYYRLSDGLDILRKLFSMVRAEFIQLSGDELSQVKQLVSFLARVKEDTHRYMSPQLIPDEETSEVFSNFLTALSLTQDQSVTKGVEHALRSIDLAPRSDWSRKIRNWDEEQEKAVTRQLDEWTKLLHDISEKDRVDLSTVGAVERMIYRFELATAAVERRMGSSLKG